MKIDTSAVVTGVVSFLVGAAVWELWLRDVVQRNGGA